jgi:hypothetical protein
MSPRWGFRHYGIQGATIMSSLRDSKTIIKSRRDESMVATKQNKYSSPKGTVVRYSGGSNLSNCIQYIFAIVFLNSIHFIIVFIEFFF